MNHLVLINRARRACAYIHSKHLVAAQMVAHFFDAGALALAAATAALLAFFLILDLTSLHWLCVELACAFNAVATLVESSHDFLAVASFAEASMLAAPPEMLLSVFSAPFALLQSSVCFVAASLRSTFTSPKDFMQALYSLLARTVSDALAPALMAAPAPAPSALRPSLKAAWLSFTLFMASLKASG